MALVGAPSADISEQVAWRAGPGAGLRCPHPAPPSPPQGPAGGLVALLSRAPWLEPSWLLCSVGCVQAQRGRLGIRAPQGRAWWLLQGLEAQASSCCFGGGSGAGS